MVAIQKHFFVPFLLLTFLSLGAFAAVPEQIYRHGPPAAVPLAPTEADHQMMAALDNAQRTRYTEANQDLHWLGPVNHLEIPNIANRAFQIAREHGGGAVGWLPGPNGQWDFYWASYIPSDTPLGRSLGLRNAFETGQHAAASVLWKTRDNYSYILRIMKFNEPHFQPPLQPLHDFLA
ncbi:uncharacterized protein MEPE_04110 [Melanopsichium pennsylvanicum]|uniref:SCP domain-containing protein n=2 Tax=Melanopsichium pennsylvanicum TaxID=63383 RepID=A0AAJ4XP74_9BASI|nr:uncharacterized protein BN887_06108 [Melanopsichium pennsylvanicum 4]SNX85401.1 uncharacterized protein MEPE_04110 [Melanopsichium pennsylvanicum]